MTTRQQRRAEERKATKTENASRVSIVIPKDFTDCMGQRWEGIKGDKSFEMDFLDVLLVTLRRCPVTDVESSERALEILTTIRDAEDGHIELRRSDYDWMTEQFKAHAHKLWTAPDAAHFRKVLKMATNTEQPE